MTPECCSCASAERLRRPVGVSEQGLLGTGGCDLSHEALRTPRTAQHLHPRLRLRGLDQEGNGDGLETDTAIRQWTDQTRFQTPPEQLLTLTVCILVLLTCFFYN